MQLLMDSTFCADILPSAFVARGWPEAATVNVNATSAAANDLTVSAVIFSFMRSLFFVRIVIINDHTVCAHFCANSQI